MAEEIPYKAEYAKSNRASCKLCKCKIDKDSLRLAKMVQSPHFDGKVPNWFHYSCFFRKFKPKNVGDVGGVESLRWEDQEKIKNNIGGSASQNGTSASKSSKAATSATTSAVNEDENLIAEYAKSSRSSCRGCDENIEKGKLRLAKMMEPSPDSNAPQSIGLIPRWHHVDCFVAERADLEVDASVTAECFTGFRQLEKEDQATLKKKLGASKETKAAKGKKRKINIEDKPQKKQKAAEEEAEENALKEQNKLVWKIRDDLRAEVPLKVLKEMLDDNGLSSQGGETSILNRCTDGIAFGQLLPCTECSGGMLVFRHEYYSCTGNMSEWTKCTFTTQDPKRTDWIISEELKEKIEFFENLKLKRRQRLFPKAAVEKMTQANMLSSGSPPDKPLFNQKFAVIGKLKKNKAEITTAIESLGGKVVEKVNSTVTCCISSPAEVDKKSKKMKDAASSDVPVVSEEFLEAVKDGGMALKVSQHSLVPWGKNKGQTCADGPPAKVKRPTSKLTSGVHEKKVTLAVKGGAVVEPESGLENSCHVLEVKGNIYNAILGLVDIVRGTNSYYKLQILRKDHGNRCHLFRSWGRVGTTIGGNKLEKCESQEDAISRFCDLYEEKTGNRWSNRKSFVKQPNRFYPLEIDYGQDEEDSKKFTIQPGSQSKLPEQVQSLIKMIFDVESMKNAMVEFEIDLKKMPLGKLTRRQIELAYRTLGEAQKLVSEAGSRNRLLDASNRFYTLIPHDFGMRKPPMLDNMDLINTKVSMLDNLLEIEVAYSLLQSGGDAEKDPIDINYEKLNTNLEVLEHSSTEFTMLSEYVKNTHASTHQQYELEVLDVFKAERHGEASQYKPFKELHNRQLLWHGSSNTNYAGILSQGLRIAPPEAPVTGYMFGKGVYFADMASKSANYCRTTPTNDVGLLLLCEVALGNMHELNNASYITKPPKGKHSVKGIGKTHPDPSGSVVLGDGTVVPKGKGVSSDVANTSLLYNEYIVYDISQIQIKYMLKLKFKYKYGW